MYRIKKAAAAIYGSNRPLLTLIYPGFDCDSHTHGIRPDKFSHIKWLVSECYPKKKHIMVLLLGR